MSSKKNPHTHRGLLWEDKKRAVYSDNERTNKHGYRVTHKPLMPSQRAEPLPGRWGLPGMDDSDGEHQADRDSSEQQNASQLPTKPALRIPHIRGIKSLSEQALGRNNSVREIRHN